jgi:hypothetical protein
MSDEDRELAINLALASMLETSNPDEALSYFNLMRALIAERSQQQIERMESDRGLR